MYRAHDMPVKSRKRTRFRTKNMTEMIWSPLPLYGNWWSRIEVTPVLMVMINHLARVGRVSAEQKIIVKVWSYDGVKFLIILLNPRSRQLGSTFWYSSAFFGMTVDSDVRCPALTVRSSSDRDWVAGGISCPTNIGSELWKWSGQSRGLQVLIGSSILTGWVVQSCTCGWFINNWRGR